MQISVEEICAEFNAACVATAEALQREIGTGENGTLWSTLSRETLLSASAKATLASAVTVAITELSELHETGDVSKFVAAIVSSAAMGALSGSANQLLAAGIHYVLSSEFLSSEWLSGLPFTMVEISAAFASTFVSLGIEFSKYVFCKIRGRETSVVKSLMNAAFVSLFSNMVSYLSAAFLPPNMMLIGSVGAVVVAAFNLRNLTNVYQRETTAKGNSILSQVFNGVLQVPYEIYYIFVGGESTQPRRDGNRNLQLPRGLECPICFQILQDPSFVKIQGVTKSTFYCRRCLDECFRRERKDPITGIEIADNEPIRECRRMKYLVEHYCRKIISQAISKKE